MTDEQLMHAHFWQAVGNIDVWIVQDTITGKSIYFLYNDGGIHERETEKEIINLAKFIVRTRGSK